VSVPIQAVIFDLDDTLLVDEAESQRALLETARFVKATSPDVFAQSVIHTAEEIWQQNPLLDWCQQLGHSSLEGLWCEYEGENEELRILADWQSKYLSKVWTYACEQNGVAQNLALEAACYFRTERDRLHPWMPGAKEVLRRIQQTQLKVAILTNGISALQWKKITRSGLQNHFHTIVVSGDYGRGKPDPSIFFHTLKKLGFTPEKCLMVGNNPRSDILGAQRAGLRTCWLQLDGVTYPKEQLAPDYTIVNLQELLTLKEVFLGP